MPTIEVSDATFARLEAQAQRKNITIEEALKQWIPPEVPPPLQGEARKLAFEKLQEMAKELGKRLPADHVVDCSRDTIYGERLDQQI